MYCKVVSSALRMNLNVNEEFCESLMYVKNQNELQDGSLFITSVKVLVVGVRPIGSQLDVG